MFRAVSNEEYDSIINNNNSFIPYDFALEMKWFASNYSHAKKWGDVFYPNGLYKIVKITIAENALHFMFYTRMLDNIGPAYAADIILLNKPDVISDKLLSFVTCSPYLILLNCS